MNKLKIDVIVGDVLAKPTTQVLLVPTLQADSKEGQLYKKLDQLLNKRLTNKSKRFSYESKKGEIFVIHEVDEKLKYDAVVIFGLGKKAQYSRSIFIESLASALKQVAELKFTSASIAIDKSLSLDEEALGQSIALALNLSQYRFDAYKSEEEKKKTVLVNQLNVYVDLRFKINDLRGGIEQGNLISEGVYLTRNLVNEPAAYVTPLVCEEEARKIEKESKGTVKVTVLDEKECRKLGMGAFLAVAQGSALEPRFIVLHYKPKKTTKNSKKICLVGKTITFDSGGLSIKPSKSMETMKLDMAGGATVLGAFHVLSQTGSSHEIYGILPACENMPSGRAIRPGDIVRPLNGKTIEILNTDAEGRLILADALSYAEKYIKPDYMIDIATLTGAIMVALGPDITGVFGNNEAFTASFLDAAEREGEKAWHMPLHKDYLLKMKSDVADLKNVSGGGLGGAITAALFLSEFVSKAKWVHLDIAGASFNEEKPTSISSKGGTGWGVRTLLRLLSSNNF